jgi:hypothetical protein
MRHPSASSTTRDSRKARSVQLRLHGTPAENRVALAALVAVLDVRTVSCPYLDRPPSTLERIYIDAIPLSEGGSK